MMTYATRIREKITKAFQPLVLELTDMSARHAGHAGAHPEGESHFHLAVVANAFEGMNRLARQRAVYALLAEELKERVHALSLELKSPLE